MSEQSKLHEIGDAEADWKIFDILCEDSVEPHCTSDHCGQSLDLITTLRSELAASSCKRDRLTHELNETKSALCAKETECESLRAQTARQSALISALQSRLQAIETRERSHQTRCDANTQNLQRDKKILEEKQKELLSKIYHLESDISKEENSKEQNRMQYQELIKKLCVCFGIDVCEASHINSECVLTKAGDIVAELHRLRTKMSSTCETLNSCESELLNLKSLSNIERQRFTAHIESLQEHNHELECKSRQLERDLEITKDRHMETELKSGKLGDELRGFESRCQRLQNTLNRMQADRLLFLRSLASIISVPESCETLLKDKAREIVKENSTMHNQLHTLRDQLALEASQHREQQEVLNCRLRNEENQRCDAEERLTKAQNELKQLHDEHFTLSDYLVRLARALSWNDCTSPPSHGTDTQILAESLLEKAERLASHHDHHPHQCEKTYWDHQGHHHNHRPIQNKPRQEKACYNLSTKENAGAQSTQRRIKTLKDQLQRRDLHLELLRRKLALLEENCRNKMATPVCKAQDNSNRTRKTHKQVEKLSQQLMDAKSELSELKIQLSESSEHKVLAMDRARKIDELTARICDLENEKSQLQSQVAALKERIRLTIGTSCHNESIINTLQEDIASLKTELSHLHAFRTTVVRTLTLSDLSESDMVHRLYALCNTHRDFTLLSRHYDESSPVDDHSNCPTRFYDMQAPSGQTHCRRPSSSQSPRRTSSWHRHSRHYNESNYSDENFGNNFDFHKKP